ncbi:hypothetical protein ACFL6Y_11445 [Elusimicrobiota bacterium]
MMATGNHAAVQGLLRLKTPAMVMRYSHLAPSYLRQAALTLDKRLGTEKEGKKDPEPSPEPVAA